MSLVGVSGADFDFLLGLDLLLGAGVLRGATSLEETGVSACWLALLLLESESLMMGCIIIVG